MLVGSDPGLNRLLDAAQAVVGIGLALGAEGLFIHLTHALQTQAGPAPLPAAQATTVAAYNHGILVLAMVMGAILALTVSIGIQAPTLRKQVPAFALVPVSALAGLAVGLAAGGQRVLSLAILVVLLAGGTYARRFGPAGVIVGLVSFAFDLSGFFSHSLVPLRQIGWPAAEIGVGLIVTVVVRVTLFRPGPAAALLRSQRSFDARARNLMKSALVVFDHTSHAERDRASLEHHLVRLNEAALIIDDQVANPLAVPEGSSSERIHQKLFDTEVALTSVSRLSALMGELALTPDQCREARHALVAVSREDTAAARDHAERLLALLDPAPDNAPETAAPDLLVAYRFATSVLGLLAAIAESDALGVEPETAILKPSVTLLGGALPGAAIVSAKISASGPRGAPRGFRFTQLHLAPYTRAAIQIAVAASVAITLGDLRSGRRFYWALIAVFVIYMGTSNAGEQVRKGILRLVGTVVGVSAGDALAHAVGSDHPYWTITVVLASMFFAIYLMKVNYIFMVVGITVTLSQLYVQTGEFTNTLLLVRLEETGIGAAVTIAVATLILPLRTRDVLRHSLHDLMTSLGELTADATAILAGETADAAALRRQARTVDAAYQTSLAAAIPIRRDFTGRTDENVQGLLRYASATRHYSRRLVFDAANAPLLDEETRAAVAQGSTALRDGLDAIAEAITGTRDGVYQSSDLHFTQLERDLKVHDTPIGALLAIQDLHRIDTAATQLADILDLAVVDLVRPGPPPGPQDML